MKIKNIHFLNIYFLKINIYFETNGSMKLKTETALEHSDGVTLVWYGAQCAFGQILREEYTGVPGVKDAQFRYITFLIILLPTLFDHLMKDSRVLFLYLFGFTALLLPSPVQLRNLKFYLEFKIFGNKV